jgi:colicin import membrane protein
MRTRVLALAAVSVLVASLGIAAVGAVASADDRTSAVSLLDVLEHDEAHRTVTAGAVTQARDALERAARMRSAGDETHARLADGLALDWALAARDLARAVDVEQQASTVRLDALDAGARAERERALLEEGIARTGRLRAELEAVERDRREAPSRTSALGASLTRGADGGGGLRPATAATRPRRGAGGMPGPAQDGGLP